MGIVVAVFMLVGLLLATPWTAFRVAALNKRPALARALGWGVMAAGAWNALWHGLRHLDYFWGVAALVSGLLMMAIAALILGARRTLKPVQTPLWLALAACWLLYTVTLVRLNLGLPILGG